MNTTTEITPVETDAQIARENAAFEMLQRQAKMFASSSLVPKEFCGNLANCAIGINIAKRLGADPFMVLQNIDVIHGRPSFRATFLIAMVNAAGRFDPLQFKLEGTEGKLDRSCVAWTKSKADGAILEGPKITLEMAKVEGWSTKNGSKWLTMPELMLRYRAAAFFARLYAPDITLGMMTAEEAIDTTERDVTPQNATESKLFQRETPAITSASAPVEVVKPKEAAKEKRPEPASVVEADTAKEPSQQDLINVTPVSLPDQIRELVKTSGVKWSEALAILKRNQITDGDFAAPDDAPDEVLIEAIHFWPSIIKLVKGGSK